MLNQHKTTIWPLSLDNSFYIGFTDKELEYICNYRSENIRFAPWLFWPTEIYSFGSCYREWLDWPMYLPIPVYGDHGVDFSSELWPHEKNNRSRFHFTWNKFKADFNKDLSTRKILYITNPWVQFRRRRDINIKPSAKGTLVFYSHTNVGIEMENFSHEKYFEELQHLPENCKPLVICMHVHDIKKGLHKEIRKYGLPIISVGNSSCSQFVNRFYDVVTSFSHATSSKWGSQLFYCIELGIPYFLYGEDPVLVNYGDENVPKGIMKPKNELAKKLNEKTVLLFKGYSPVINTDQKEFVRDILGLDATLDRSKINLIFKKEFIRLLPYYIYTILKTVYNRIFKIS